MTAVVEVAVNVRRNWCAPTGFVRRSVSRSVRTKAVATMVAAPVAAAARKTGFAIRRVNVRRRPIANRIAPERSAAITAVVGHVENVPVAAAPTSSALWVIALPRLLRPVRMAMSGGWIVVAIWPNAHRNALGVRV